MIASAWMMLDRVWLKSVIAESKKIMLWSLRHSGWKARMKRLCSSYTLPGAAFRTFSFMFLKRSWSCWIWKWSPFSNNTRVHIWSIVRNAGILWIFNLQDTTIHLWKHFFTCFLPHFTFPLTFLSLLSLFFYSIYNFSFGF